MGKLLQTALKPTGPSESGPHADMEDLACLIEGKLGGEARQNLLRHLNRCAQCYQILQETIKDHAAAPVEDSTPVAGWKTKSVYALAASIVLLMLIGGPLVYKFQTRQSSITSAELILDQELKEILLEDDTLQWHRSERIKRLISALQKKGYHLKSFDRVVLSKPYYQVKSLLGPKEILVIRIDANVAYLEVREAP
jgi:hypothetical protein